MYPFYDDLRSRLGEPQWVDAQGVPRYDKYKPGEQDIHANFDCLLLVKCQGCGQTFLVGSWWSIPAAVRGLDKEHWDIAWDESGHNGKPKFMPTEEGPGSFGFGDAPYHEFDQGTGMCIGTTMTTEDVRIVEFWECSDQPGTEKFMKWVRKPEYEVVFKREDSDG